MESVCSLAECSPITQQWCVFTLVTDQVISHYGDANTCRSHVFLCSCVNYSIFRPVDRLAAEVGGHITDEGLACWYFIIWEAGEFKTLNCFIVTVVEILCISINLPVCWLSNCSVFRLFVICNLSRCAVFLDLINGSLRPCPSCQVICFSTFTVSK